MRNMHYRSLRCLAILAFSASLLAWGQGTPKQDPPKQEADRKARGPLKRRLTLVRGKKQATVFEYVETVYFAEHK